MVKKIKLKIKVDKKAQEEVNEIRKKCGLKEKPIKEDYELECLYG